ncbi:MAG: DNA polymerase III subunit delta [Lachnospiraceae bacterium]|nr:DNA polymerase III subunit delta [Lachnospiraceae bacterium]
MAETNWNDVAGQRQLTDDLRNALKFNKISHAYLIQGEKLSGKRMVADIFARALQCEAEGEERPCNKCRACRQALNGNHPDIIYVEHEKPNVISVENIRQQINGDIMIKPYSGERKVYVVDEAEKMNVQAQNALLKTLEEPPDYAVILLLCVNAEVMLPTILSRCVMLSTRPVHEALIKDYLMRRAQVPDYRASVCASFARGNVGRAAQLASNEEFDRMKSSVIGAMKTITDMEINQMAAEAKRMTEEKFDSGDYLDLCFIWYRDVLLYKACGAKSPIIFKEETADIAQAAKRYSFEGLERIVHAIERAKSRLKANVNFDLTMEILFMEMKSAQ